MLGKETLYGLKVSSKEFDFYNTMNKNNRGFNMATFDMTKYPNSEKVAYGKNNSEKFVKYDLSKWIDKQIRKSAQKFINWEGKWLV